MEVYNDFLYNFVPMQFFPLLANLKPSSQIHFVPLGVFMQRCSQESGLQTPYLKTIHTLIKYDLDTFTPGNTLQMNLSLSLSEPIQLHKQSRCIFITYVLNPTIAFFIHRPVSTPDLSLLRS